MSVTLLYADGFGGYEQSAASSAFAQLGSAWSRDDGNTRVASQEVNGPASLAVRRSTNPDAALQLSLTDRCVVGWASRPDNVRSDETRRGFFWLRNSSQETKVRVALQDGEMQLLVGDTVVDTHGAVPSAGVVAYFEIEYRSDASDGYVRVYMDNALVLEETGDTEGASGDVAEAIWSNQSDESTSGQELHIGALYAGTFTGDPDAGTIRLGPQVVFQGLPDADVSADWEPDTGTDNVDRVDEQPNDGDSSYVESDTPGDVDRYSIDLSELPAGTIACLVQKTLDRTPEGGSPTLRHRLWSDGNPHDGDDFVPPGDYRAHLTLWPEDPETSAAWLVADAQAAESGMEHVDGS